MNKFINQKNKINKIIQQNNSNYPVLIRQDINNNQRKELLNIQLKSPEQQYKKNYIASTEWENMIYGKSLEGVIKTSPVLLFSKWKIEFSKFDYRLLGHIRVEPIIKPLNLNVNDNIETTFYWNLYKAHFFTIYDLENEEFFKKVILTSGLTIYNSGDEIPYQRQAKLLIHYINPIKVI